MALRTEADATGLRHLLHTAGDVDCHACASCSTARPVSSRPVITSPECRPIRIEGGFGRAATASCMASAARQASNA